MSNLTTEQQEMMNELISVASETLIAMMKEFNIPCVIAEIYDEDGIEYHFLFGPKKPEEVEEVEETVSVNFKSKWEC
mgnify:CR=1 FL=1